MGNLPGIKFKSCQNSTNVLMVPQNSTSAKNINKAIGVSPTIIRLLLVKAESLHTISAWIYNTYGQFHQHFTHTFLVRKWLHAAFFYLHVTREKLPKRLSYKKVASKTLMKLTPSVNFHHQFSSSFCAKNYKSVLEKNCVKHFCSKKLLLKCCWNWHLVTFLK